MKKPLALARFLMSIACLTDEAWGLHPAIRYASSTVAARRSLRSRPPPKPSPPVIVTDMSDDDNKDSSPNDVSYIPSSSTSQLESVDPFVGATITAKVQLVFLGACLFRRYSLTGRGTCVIGWPCGCEAQLDGRNPDPRKRVSEQGLRDC